MGIKLVTVLVLARFLGVETFAIFGLFLVTVTMSLYLVGLDFYAFSLRELIAAPEDEKGWITKQHFSVMLCSALCILPPLAVAQAWLPLGTELAAWLVVIVFLEHLGLECVRLLVARGAPLEASISAALRTAAWGPPLLLLLYLDPQLATLDTVFIAWASGSALALLYGVITIRRLGLGGWSKALDLDWIRRGFAVALPLLAATLALRLLFTVDRYALEWLCDLEQLAAYVLFTTLAGGVIGLADATFSVFSYPALVDAHSRRDRRRFIAELKSFFIAIALFVLFGSAALYFSLPLLLAFLGEQSYLDHRLMFPWVLAGAGSYLLSTVVHYGLFAGKRDTAILVANVLSLACLPLSVLVLQRMGADQIVPIAMFLSFLLLFLLKSLLLARAFRKNAIAS
jgi:O-antigen/teichoic acid export membrane protein